MPQHGSHAAARFSLTLDGFCVHVALRAPRPPIGTTCTPSDAHATDCCASVGTLHIALVVTHLADPVCTFLPLPLSPHWCTIGVIPRFTARYSAHSSMINTVTCTYMRNLGKSGISFNAQVVPCSLVAGVGVCPH